VAGVLTWRQGSSLCCWSDPTLIGPTRRLAVQSVGTGRTGGTWSKGGMYPRYAPSGHLVYAPRGELDGRAVRSPAASRPLARQFPWWRGVLQSPFSGAAQYKHFRPRDRWSMFREVLRPHSSDWSGSVAMERSRHWPPRRTPTRTRTFSPDGRRVAVGITEAGDAKPGCTISPEDTLTRLTFWGEGQHESGLDIGWQGAWCFSRTRKGRRTFSGSRPTAVGALGATHNQRVYRCCDVLVSEWANCLPSLKSLPVLDMTFGCCGISDRKPQPFLRTPFNESVPQVFPRRALAGLYLGRIRPL